MFSPTVENVLSVYTNSTSENLNEGMDWYVQAHDFALSLDPAIERSAGIIAALSPLSGWDNNKNKAAQLYRQNGFVSVKENGGNGIGLWANVCKAQNIFFGADPDNVLKGLKVRAFYETILNPTLVSTTPVIDRHAFDIAVGKRTDDNARQNLTRKNVYAEFADVYRLAALEADIGTAQMQAVTWVTWREIHGVA